ncbi:MAG: uroporphyrinogen-III synthase [Burkholderiales bacterium]
MSETLGGRGVVVTRPAGEARRLAALIREAGGEPLLYPAIEILDAPDTRVLDGVIDRLDAFDLAIFISPSAVEKAMTRIVARRALPAQLRIAAIGPGGVRALQRFGVTDVVAPHSRYDSESLLASPYLHNVQGQRIVIFRGDGGRELLGETLAARGAAVEYAACYRRAKPVFDAAPLIQAWERHTVAGVIVTSSEGLRHFCERIGVAGRTWLQNTLIVVPHQRIHATARELGMMRVVESESGDEALVRTLTDQLSA